MENSKIEWTDHTANLWHGCTKVHEGCDNCYAEALARRWGNDIWGHDKPRKLIKSVDKDLKKYQTVAQAANLVHRVFVGSMMDIFEKPMPLIDSSGNRIQGMDSGTLRDNFFMDIDSGAYPNLMFLLLTKRPSNINKYIPVHWQTNPPKNVMYGTSVVNQATYERLCSQLLEVNGKRFLSMEPQLEHIHLDETDGIDWIIQGGESGPRRRPFRLEWASSMRWQCSYLGISYFFKQIDKKQPIPEDMLTREFPE